MVDQEVSIDSALVSSSIARRSRTFQRYNHEAQRLHLCLLYFHSTILWTLHTDLNSR